MITGFRVQGLGFRSSYYVGLELRFQASDTGLIRFRPPVTPMLLRVGVDSETVLRL